MYEVFIQNHRIKLSSDESFSAAGTRISGAEEREYWCTKIAEQIKDDMLENWTIHDDAEKFLDALWEKFERIEAAGGRIHDEKGRLLMIYRLGHWDLPKGKIEAGESPEEAAFREIEEECGLSALKELGKLNSSYHIYPQRGIWYLKKTHWFRYEMIKYQELVPQAEEGIEKIEWLTPDEVQARKDLIYPSLYALLEE